MKRLIKSNDKMIAGVLSGIAEYFGWDSTLVRIVYTIATFLGGGSPILLYIVLAFIIPEE